MSSASITGLSCPRCGGMVPIPEGQFLVACPYCDLRSVVSSDEAVQPASAGPALPAPSAAQAIRIAEVRSDTAGG